MRKIRYLKSPASMSSQQRKQLKPAAGNENQTFLDKRLWRIITQKFEENQAVLKSKFSNTNANKMKQGVGEQMTIAANAV